MSMFRLFLLSVWVGLIGICSTAHDSDTIRTDAVFIDNDHVSKAYVEYSKHASVDTNKAMRSYDAREEYNNHAAALAALLFPHAKGSSNPLVRKEASTGSYHAVDYSTSERKLADLYPCVICRDMSFCPSLNGYQIQEVYLPYNLNDLGTCKVLDALGSKVSTEVFGNGRTFRDTPQCRDIVMQYLCLFYGSDNEMYTNQCINQEDVTSSNPKNHKVAPRPPCRSFCVQVAEVCASDGKFMQLCNNIKCPPMEDACTPDPMVEGQVLAANIGCDMPYNINPYFKKNSASGKYSSPKILLIVHALVLLIGTAYGIL
jgi:hypothetical protein